MGGILILAINKKTHMISADADACEFFQLTDTGDLICPKESTFEI
jgi:hypothetical protein